MFTSFKWLRGAFLYPMRNPRARPVVHIGEACLPACSSDRIFNFIILPTRMSWYHLLLPHSLYFFFSFYDALRFSFVFILLPCGAWPLILFHPLFSMLLTDNLSGLYFLDYYTEEVMTRECFIALLQCYNEE